MASVRIVRFNPNHQDNQVLFNLVIDLYRQVFAVAPWREWKKCEICGSFWGREDEKELEAMNFTHCSRPLVDFWPCAEVRNEWLEEITPEASSWIALDGCEPIGFCYGYPIRISDLEKKLGVVFEENLETLFDGNVNGSVAYQDEMGVHENYRGCGIAKQMYLMRLIDFLNNGFSIGVMRTRETPEPSVTYKWFMRIGYKIIARYPGTDGRVILAHDLRKVAGIYKESIAELHHQAVSP